MKLPKTGRYELAGAKRRDHKTLWFRCMACNSLQARLVRDDVAATFAGTTIQQCRNCGMESTYVETRQAG